ncbi:hypothetical protein PYCC9005_003486 [Savitreella phatthalungensis]
MLFRAFTALFLLVACAHAMVVPLPQRLHPSDISVALTPLAPPPHAMLPSLPTTGTPPTALIRHTRIRVIKLADNARLVIKSTWFTILRACGLRSGNDAGHKTGAHGHGRVSGGLTAGDIADAQAHHKSHHRHGKPHGFPALFWATRARHGHKAAVCQLVIASFLGFFMTLAVIGGGAVLFKRRRAARRGAAAATAAAAPPTYAADVAEEYEPLVQQTEKKSDDGPDDRPSSELLPPYTKAEDTA